MSGEAMFSQYESWREANRLSRTSMSDIRARRERGLNADPGGANKCFGARASLRHDIVRLDVGAGEQIEIGRRSDPVHEPQHLFDELVDNAGVVVVAGDIGHQADDHMHLQHRDGALGGQVFAVIGHWFLHMHRRIRARFGRRVE